MEQVKKCGTCKHYERDTRGLHAWDYGDCLCPVPDIAKEEYYELYTEADMGTDCDCWETQ